MSAKDEVFTLLQSSGAIQLRSKKHTVWRLPGGKRWATPKTPSDYRGWANNLSDLKKFLGIQASVKKQEDFDHKKKEAFVPEVEVEEVFLGNLPEREERVKTPEGPTLDELRGIDKPREIFALGGKVPVRVKHRSGYERHLAATPIRYSKEVTMKANFIFETQGEKEMQEFLRKIREENTVDNGVNGTGSLGSHASEKVIEGGLERELANARDNVRIHRATALKATEEAQRWEKIAEAVEIALRIAGASRSDLQKMFVNGNGVQKVEANTPSGQKPKGYWKQTIREVVGTAPVSLTRLKLVDELQKLYPEQQRGNLYQAVLKACKDGTLKENEESGLLRVEACQ